LDAVDDFEDLLLEGGGGDDGAETVAWDGVAVFGRRGKKGREGVSIRCEADEGRWKGEGRGGKVMWETRETREETEKGGEGEEKNETNDFEKEKR